MDIINEFLLESKSAFTRGSEFISRKLEEVRRDLKGQTDADISLIGKRVLNGIDLALQYHLYSLKNFRKINDHADSTYIKLRSKNSNFKIPISLKYTYLHDLLPDEEINVRASSKYKSIYSKSKLVLLKNKNYLKLAQNALSELDVQLKRVYDIHVLFKGSIIKDHNQYLKLCKEYNLLEKSLSGYKQNSALSNFNAIMQREFRD